jgi:hypothetical protein
MTRTPPSYVPNAIIGAPIDFPWKGTRAHAGPMQTMTKLLDRLSGTTTCGQITMCAGIVEWLAWRLQGHLPIENTLHFCDAAFAYQVDHRYADRDAGDITNPPAGPPECAALMELGGYLWDQLKPKFLTSYYQPVPETFHASHVTRHTTPKAHKKTFDGWLAGLSDRVHTVAAKPDEEFKKKQEFDDPAELEAFYARHFGRPLPREILDPDAIATPPEPLIAAFLAGLDYHANPYLRTPEQMRELGFPGEPYKL